MKEVTKTITVFEALDGTCFDKKENCERYEEQLRGVEFFKVLYNPELTETGKFMSTSYFAVYSKYGYNEAILQEYMRKETKRPIVGPSVMGYGLQLHYFITKVERSEIDLERLTILSPIELDWYSDKKYEYYDYMTEWGLK